MRKRHKILSLTIGIILSARSILTAEELPKDELKPILGKCAEYCRKFIINI